MNVWFRFIPLALVACLSGTSVEPTTDKACISMINNFGIELTRHFDENDNVFVSPESISKVLAMLYVRAGGKTREQIMKAFLTSTPGIDESLVDSCLHDLLRKDSFLPDGITSELHVAEVFQEEIEPKEAYSQIYDSHTMLHVDFKNDMNSAKNSINEWASNVTRGIIKDMLPDHLDPDTKMLLLFGTYFAAPWQKPFDKANTHDGSFHLLNGTSKPVKMMSKTNEDFLYYHDEKIGYKFLAIPFKAKHLSMLLALPDKTEYPQPHIRTTIDMIYVVEKLKNVKMGKVVLPRVRQNRRYDLKGALTSMGITDIFSSSADLTGIGKQGDLWLSTILTKQIREINEEGVLGASTSGHTPDMEVARALDASNKEFVADHPFRFFVINITDPYIVPHEIVLDLE